MSGQYCSDLSTARHHTWPYGLSFFALLLGILHAQSFAPFNAWWLQLLCLASLYFLSCQQRSVGHAVILGWAFGLGWFASGLWWLYISMHFYGHLPAPLAVLAVFFLAAFLALFPACALGLTHKLCDHPPTIHYFTQHKNFPLRHALIAACAWGVSEWLRGTLLTGFPWLAIGYAHSDSPLSGYAALIGVYGISAIAAGVAALLAQIHIKKHRWKIIFVIGFIFCAGWAMPQLRFTQALERFVTVQLVQGNIPQDLKFDPHVFEANLNQQTALMTANPADLIVASETALPIRLVDLPLEILARLKDFSISNHSQVLFGALGQNQRGELSNSLLTLDGYRYDKSHLVPFGEFIPWGFNWFVSWMQMPLGNFSRGTSAQAPLQINGTAFLPNICYEDLFGEEIARNLRAHRANVLLNATNIAWFGNTRALDQHLQIARLRSLETQLPTLRATNTGTTAWIDDRGQVRAALPPFQAGSLAVKIQGYQGLTPFVRFGNLPLLVFATGFLLLVALLRTRQTG